MKVYKYEKTVLAQPMMHDKAEIELGVKIPNLFHGSEGYLVEEDGNKKWVPRSVFEKGAIPFDTSEERIEHSISVLKDMVEKTKEYYRSHSASTSRYQKLLTCRRHLQLCADLLTKILKNDKNENQHQ